MAADPKSLQLDQRGGREAGAKGSINVTGTHGALKWRASSPALGESTVRREAFGRGLDSAPEMRLANSPQGGRAYTLYAWCIRRSPLRYPVLLGALI
jgi:hypothetical protein